MGCECEPGVRRNHEQPVLSAASRNGELLSGDSSPSPSLLPVMEEALAGAVQQWQEGRQRRWQALQCSVVGVCSAGSGVQAGSAV